MSLWGKIKKGVKKAAKVVGDGIKQNAKALAGALVAPYKDAYHAIKHTAKGVLKWLKGDKAGARREFEKAKQAAKEIGPDILSGPVNVVLMWGANYLSAGQRLLGAEDEPRKLTDGEKKLLQPIFRDSVDYDAVDVIEGNLGLLGSTNSVFTLAHRIRVANGSGYVPLAKHQHVLVHEMLHVWQFEAGGPDYIGEALVAQATGDGGHWLDESGAVVSAPKGYGFDTAVAGGKHWTDFNPEQQATFIEVAFQLGVNFANPDATPMLFNGADYTSELKTALDYIRAGEDYR